MSYSVILSKFFFNCPFKFENISNKMKFFQNKFCMVLVRVCVLTFSLSNLFLFKYIFWFICLHILWRTYEILLVAEKQTFNVLILWLLMSTSFFNWMYLQNSYYNLQWNEYESVMIYSVLKKYDNYQGSKFCADYFRRVFESVIFKSTIRTFTLPIISHYLALSELHEFLQHYC